MKKIFKLVGVIIIILLIFTAFITGRFLGELKNRQPFLNSCHTIETVPYENYVELSVGRFDDMYRLFYGEHRHKFDKIIMPKQNMSYEEYYTSLKYNRFEYFSTTEGLVIKCGMFK